ncbi:hypothetical protein D3C77_534570 [compost metagenome]
MDKRKVIEAYQRGFLSVQECAQILGLEGIQVRGLLDKIDVSVLPTDVDDKKSASGFSR